MTYLVIASQQLHFLKLERPAGALVGAVASAASRSMPHSS